VQQAKEAGRTSLDDFIRQREHVRWNRQADLRKEYAAHEAKPKGQSAEDAKRKNNAFFFMSSLPLLLLLFAPCAFLFTALRAVLFAPCALLLNHPVRSRQHVGRNHQANLIRRF
jgi:hypothetical protein